MEKNIFIFDENKCVGCSACSVACMNENGFQSPEQWRNIHNSQTYHFPDIPLFYLSIACNHCDDAPCMKNCPALAYSRDPNTGAVIHHPEKCIGCKYCTWACPYEAPKYNPLKGIIEKCTFCNTRIEDGLKPACANLCPTGALDFANTEFTIQESAESSPVPVEVGSNIKIKKLRKPLGPEQDLELFKNQTDSLKPIKKHPKISALEEWPLIIFSLLSTGLVTIYSTGLTQTFTPNQKIIFLGFAAIAALFSMAHLGKKTRAWRSILNLKNSWLSKEILTFGLFTGYIFVDFYIIGLPHIIGIFLGFSLLLAIDLLYFIAMWRWPIKIHSAQTVFIAITLITLMYNEYLLFGSIVLIRLVLYIFRKLKIPKVNLYSTIIRTGFLLLGTYIYYMSGFLLTSIIIILLGDILDRIEFYNELRVPDPKEEIRTQ